MSGVDKKKHKSVKSTPTREMLENKFKNLLPANLRGSSKRASNARGSTKRDRGSVLARKVGTTNSSLEPEHLGGVMPQMLSKAHNSNRNIRNRALSGASSVSESKANETVLHTGCIKKKGVINQSWKNRFFVLTSRNLYYLEKEPEGINVSALPVTAKGVIPFEAITTIEKDKPKKAKDKELATKFSIYTPTRIYRLQVVNENGDSKQAVRDLDAWIGSIAGAIENFKQMYHHGRKESGFSLEWIKGHEKAIAEDNIHISLLSKSKSNRSSSKVSHGPNEPARLGNWVNWSTFDVAAWLYKVDLKKEYSELFYENKIDGAKLQDMTKKDLLKVGVTSQDDQMKILSAVEELKSMPSP